MSFPSPEPSKPLGGLDEGVMGAQDSSGCKQTLPVARSIPIVVVVEEPLTRGKLGAHIESRCKEVVHPAGYNVERGVRAEN